MPDILTGIANPQDLNDPQTNPILQLLQQSQGQGLGDMQPQALTQDQTSDPVYQEFLKQMNNPIDESKLGPVDNSDLAAQAQASIDKLMPEIKMPTEQELTTRRSGLTKAAGSPLELLDQMKRQSLGLDMTASPKKMAWLGALKDILESPRTKGKGFDERMMPMAEQLYAAQTGRMGALSSEDRAMYANQLGIAGIGQKASKAATDAYLKLLGEKRKQDVANLTEKYRQQLNEIRQLKIATESRGQDVRAQTARIQAQVKLTQMIGQNPIQGFIQVERAAKMDRPEFAKYKDTPELIPLTSAEMGHAMQEYKKFIAGKMYTTTSHVSGEIQKGFPNAGSTQDIGTRSPAIPDALLGPVSPLGGNPPQAQPQLPSPGMNQQPQAPQPQFPPVPQGNAPNFNNLAPQTATPIQRPIAPIQRPPVIAAGSPPAGAPSSAPRLTPTGGYPMVPKGTTKLVQASDTAYGHASALTEDIKSSIINGSYKAFMGPLMGNDMVSGYRHMFTEVPTYEKLLDLNLIDTLYGKLGANVKGRFNISEIAGHKAALGKKSDDPLTTLKSAVGLSMFLKFHSDFLNRDARVWNNGNLDGQDLAKVVKAEVDRYANAVRHGVDPGNMRDVSDLLAAYYKDPKGFMAKENPPEFKGPVNNSDDFKKAHPYLFPRT